jgi:ribulose-phosphate 3-epimerase
MSKKFEIMPAILEKRKRDIKHKLFQMEEVAQSAQIDVVDGKFAPKLSWPYSANIFDNLFGNYNLNFKGDLELHLMVNRNLDFLDEYGTLSCSRLVSHIESGDFKEIANSFQDYGFKSFGASILLDTPISTLDEYVDRVDFIQVMGIAKVGVQGSGFEDRAIDRVVELKTKYPHLLISVDGGVNENNIQNLYRAGAERFAVGSAIFKKKNPGLAYKELENLLK